jgi:hypothetical protein
MCESPNEIVAPDLASPQFKANPCPFYARLRALVSKAFTPRLILRESCQAVAVLHRRCLAALTSLLGKMQRPGGQYSFVPSGEPRHPTTGLFVGGVLRRHHWEWPCLVSAVCVYLATETFRKDIAEVEPAERQIIAEPRTQ